jgi:hypothetical protein
MLGDVSCQGAESAPGFTACSGGSVAFTHPPVPVSTGVVEVAVGVLVGVPLDGLAGALGNSPPRPPSPPPLPPLPPLPPFDPCGDAVLDGVAGLVVELDDECELWLPSPRIPSRPPSSPEPLDGEDEGDGDAVVGFGVGLGLVVGLALGGVVCPPELDDWPDPPEGVAVGVAPLDVAVGVGVADVVSDGHTVGNGNVGVALDEDVGEAAAAVWSDGSAMTANRASGTVTPTATLPRRP